MARGAGVTSPGLCVPSCWVTWGHSERGGRAAKIAVHPTRLCVPLVNGLFVSFAESTDNFVSSKSALPFALKLIYSESWGNYGIQMVLFPRPRSLPHPRPQAAQHFRVNGERGLQSGNALPAHLLGSLCASLSPGRDPVGGLCLDGRGGVGRETRALQRETLSVSAVLEPGAPPPVSPCSRAQGVAAPHLTWSGD